METASISRFEYPRIICGGMGANISNLHLAREVSTFEWQNTTGVALGTVSGVALERVMARTLQLGGKSADDIKVTYVPIANGRFYANTFGNPGDCSNLNGMDSKEQGQDKGQARIEL